MNSNSSNKTIKTQADGETKVPTKMNFKYTVYQEDELNTAAIDKSLKVKDYGINKVAITMNMQSIRD